MILENICKHGNAHIDIHVLTMLRMTLPRYSRVASTPCTLSLFSKNLVNMSLPHLTVEDIRAAVIGDNMPMPGPFGARALIYADHVASGRALTYIEDAIREHVLPNYGNTHTETSWCGRRTTALREAARAAIRRAVEADENHAVIFAGAGATGAADKLVRGLALGPDAAVFVGPYEHHSNDLPWRECEAELVRIPLDADGGVCFATLERELSARAGRKTLIGAFSAASNVTGVLTDLSALAKLLHRHGAALVCDYAAAGPYVPIRLAESAPGAGDRIDAALVSPHKFIGGPGASGVLIADRAMFTSEKPTTTGGGTVSYVTAGQHVYVKDVERREEAGTPAIVDNIRAGMVFEIKDHIGAEEVTRREHALTARLDAALRAEPAVELLGPRDANRLGIYSFNIRAGEKLLHHNYVVALLNDLFGVQARGGCSCAGPYGHELLGIDETGTAAHECLVARGLSVFRPGWARLGVSWFFDEATVDHIGAAIAFIAQRGLDFLPIYSLDAGSGVWRAEPALATGAFAPMPAADEPVDLSALWLNRPAALPAAPSFRDCLAEAHRLADLASQARPAGQTKLDAECEALRWFWLPHETAAACTAAPETV